jgi:hypothetical protein
MIKGEKPQCPLDSSSVDILRESQQDLVSYGSDGGMNPTYVDHLQDPERQSDWFASLLDSPRAILVDAVECNVTSHSLER